MTTERLFTPDEATRTLPLVRRITADFLAAGQALRALGETGLDPHQVERERQRLTTRLEDLTAEFEQIGCYFKDWNFEIGLVDFPSVVHGRKVLLCWRSDEARIGWYHGYDEGYTGRRPLPAEALTST